MKEKFNQWRLATMQVYSCGGLAHYHRVEDSVFSFVRGFLYSFIKEWLDNQQSQFVISLNSETIQMLFDFLLQMDYSYMHPRSDSAKFQFARNLQTLSRVSRENPSAIPNT